MDISAQQVFFPPFVRGAFSALWFFICFLQVESVMKFLVRVSASRKTSILWVD